MGLCACPPSEEMRTREGPMVLMQWAMVAASVKAQRGVMEQKTNSTRTCGCERICTSGRLSPGALSYGWVRMSLRNPCESASATRAAISSKETWPVARAAPRSRTSAITSRASGMRRPSARRWSPSPEVSMPLDCAAKPPPKPKAWRWQAASRVGIQITRSQLESGVHRVGVHPAHVAIEDETPVHFETARHLGGKPSSVGRALEVLIHVEASEAAGRRVRHHLRVVRDAREEVRRRMHVQI